jgi:hypothetical protein
VQGGENKDLTLKNLDEYLHLVLHFTFHETVKCQIDAFKKGFNRIFPIDKMKCFSYEELEQIVCGSMKDEEWTEEVLFENIVPSHGYHSKR